MLLAIEDARAPARADLDVLLESARSSDTRIQLAAIRALGRLERRDVAARLVSFLRHSNAAVRDEAANAVAQAFRGRADGPAGPSLKGAFEALTGAPRRDAIHRSIGRLPYTTAPEFRAAEAYLRSGLARPAPSIGAARGLESLARLHRKFLPFEADTLDRLRALASRAEGTDPVDVRRNAMAALLASQGADAGTVVQALDDPDEEVRRLALLVAGGAGSPLEPDQRRDLVDAALSDRSPMVRLEAVRAFLRRPSSAQGCQPLLGLLDDSSTHVVAAVLDGLGDQCRDDQAITDRLASESRTPPTTGSWQREAHAFVSLAQRSRERASMALPTFAMHARPQVRVYAARAAAALGSVDWLTRLAGDPDDNVVEAALPPLRRLAGAESDPLFVAALNRRPRGGLQGPVARPYQALLAAARELKGAAPGPALAGALAGALTRVTSDRCDTSRDVRLELIERLGELGGPAQGSALAPLLRDQDPRVASAAAALLERWTGRPQEIVTPARESDVPSARDLAEPVHAVIEMEAGGSFALDFYDDQAPLAMWRFVRLARAHYYDGLTFHRVVPNFVIQGGSPNANEYCGDCPFIRDEVGLLMHVRGTIGVSTRGRDTGDAQIFVNLVDNARLDHDYTVFARVCGNGMDVVDRVQEVDRIGRVRIVPGRCAG